MDNFQWTDELVKEFMTYTFFPMSTAQKLADKFINDFKKSKEVKPKIRCFTTEDGVQLFKGDSYVKLNNYSDWSIVIGFIAEGNGDMYKGLKFSTKEAAQEWIIWNKPVLSLADVMASSEWFDGNNEFENRTFNKTALKKTVQSKIK